MVYVQKRGLCKGESETSHLNDKGGPSLAITFQDLNVA